MNLNSTFKIARIHFNFLCSILLMMFANLAIQAQVSNDNTYNYQVNHTYSFWGTDLDIFVENPTFLLSVEDDTDGEATDLFDWDNQSYNSCHFWNEQSPSSRTRNQHLLTKLNSTSGKFDYTMVSYEKATTGPRCLAEGSAGDNFEYKKSWLIDALQNPLGQWNAEHTYSIISNSSETRLKTVVRLSNGDSWETPLDFGTLTAGQSKSHININYAAPAGANQYMGYIDNWGDIENGFPNHAAPDVTYQFHIASPMVVTISTANSWSDYDTYIHLVQDFNAIAQYTSNHYIEGDDNDGAGNKSEISRLLCAGTYLVVVEGFDDNVGTFDLSISAEGGAVSAGNIAYSGSTELTTNDHNLGTITSTTNASNTYSYASISWQQRRKKSSSSTWGNWQNISDNDGNIQTYTFSGGLTAIDNEPTLYQFKRRIQNISCNSPDYLESNIIGFLVIHRPVNDLCTNALPITCGDLLNGSTFTATFEGTLELMNCAPNENDLSAGVWYYFEGTGNPVIFSTENGGTDFDTELFLYETTTNCSDLVCVDGNDDVDAFNLNFSSSISLISEVGKTYFLYLDGHNDVRGNYELSATCNGTVDAEVFYRVDMNNQVVSENGVHIAGDFQSESGFPDDWNPATTQLLEMEPGIYERRVLIKGATPGETFMHKFINGNDWSTSEDVPIACGMLEGCCYNRFLEIPIVGAASMTTDSPCYNTCVACAALPIDLLVFEGEVLKEGNHIYWKTGHELGISAYELERSVDGFHFETLSKIPALTNNNVEKYYEWSDSNPLLMSWYRLKTLEESGQYQYSDMIYLERKSSITPSTIKLYPTPAKEQIFIAFETVNAENVQVQLFSSNSQLIQSIRLNSIKGLNTKELMLTNLPAGLYMIKVLFENGQIHTEKILKN